MLTNHTLTPPREAASVGEGSDAGSPFVVEFFMVQSAGFRGMAYRDQTGTWRSAFNNDELVGDIYILD